jgi:general nucleoside transport system permease protein
MDSWAGLGGAGRRRLYVGVLIAGLTSFLYSTLLSPNQETLNSPPYFPTIDIPLLSQIPIIGPVFFSQTIIMYFAYIAVALVLFALFKTH